MSVTAHPAVAALHALVAALSKATTPARVAAACDDYTAAMRESATRGERCGCCFGARGAVTGVPYVCRSCSALGLSAVSA